LPKAGGRAAWGKIEGTSWQKNYTISISNQHTKENRKMKKKLIALLAGALLTVAMAGNALAYFGDVTGSDYVLTRVVYDANGTKEVATDLGTVNSLTGAVNWNSGAASAFDLSMFGAAASWDNLYVAYFAKSFADTDVWVSGVGEVGGISANRKMGDTNTRIANANSYYNSLGGSTGTVIADQGYVNSYFRVLDLNTDNKQTLGTFYMNQQPGLEMSLAALASGGFVEQSLFWYDSANSIASGVKVATIRTLADGTSTINPSAVPVPAAVYLLGSGLLGLVGLRRRIS
jgi:hypothetical protein